MSGMLQVEPYVLDYIQIILGRGQGGEQEGGGGLFIFFLLFPILDDKLKKRPLGLTAPLSNNTLPMIHSQMNTQLP